MAIIQEIKAALINSFRMVMDEITIHDVRLINHRVAESGQTIQLDCRFGKKIFQHVL